MKRVGRTSKIDAISRTAAVIIIIVILIIAAGAVYAGVFLKKGTTTPTTSSSSSSSPSQNSLIVEEGDQPDSLDPAVTFVTPGWEPVEQIYQGLVAPNGQSYTTYIGVLATNWTVSASGMNYTFSLVHDATFSDGEKFNAYVEWFSVYRTILMNQAPEFILGQNLAANNGAGFAVTAAELNSMNYQSPSSANISVMQYPHQSVQVINQYEIQFNLGYGYNGMAPYSSFLATLITPMAMAVAPGYVEAHGGVAANTTNSWMATNAVGTGFYTLKSWVSGQSLTMTKNTAYWGDSAPSSEINYATKPAIINTITILYKTDTARIADLISGSAQVIEAPVQDYNVVKAVAGVNASILPVVFGSSEGEYYLYMDQPAFVPFQNILVREAISYGIDYSGLISSAYGGLAVQYIGPVPPGFPFYNQSVSGLGQYTYNQTKAALLLAQAGYQATLPNGTTISGQAFPSANFLYDSDSAAETNVAQDIKSELNAIGFNFVLSPLPSGQVPAQVYSLTPNSTSYPFGLTYYSEDFTASIDYVTALATGNYVGTSGYYNTTVVGWTTAAATAFDNQTIISNFQNITRAMYNNYIDIWLYVPYLLAVHKSNVAGFIPNPAGSGAGYFMFYNSIYFTS